MSDLRLRTAVSCLLVSCLLLPLAGCSTSVASTPGESDAADASAASERTAAISVGPSTALAARKKAAADGKYLFAFFSKTKDENTTAMRSVFDKAMTQVEDRASAVAVQITDPAEKSIVAEYGLERAPMPLVLAIAPNGAITGGFPAKFSERDLLSAFATPATERCLKPLQEGKLVFLCVQSEQTRMNDEAMQGVKGFAADERFRDAVKIVTLNPTAKAEASFLKDLQIDSATKTALTVFMAPPGTPIAIYEGATNKDEMVSTLQEASSACGPGGCGPGGCGPQ